MEKKKRLTCSQIRSITNGIMTAGFFMVCTAIGTYGGDEGLSEFLFLSGSGLVGSGFLLKGIWWKCPYCNTHLILCTRPGEKSCPRCGRQLTGYR